MYPRVVSTCSGVYCSCTRAGGTLRSLNPFMLCNPRKTKHVRSRWSTDHREERPSGNRADVSTLVVRILCSAPPSSRRLARFPQPAYSLANGGRGFPRLHTRTLLLRQEFRQLVNELLRASLPPYPLSFILGHYSPLGSPVSRSRIPAMGTFPRGLRSTRFRTTSESCLLPFQRYTIEECPFSPLAFPSQGCGRHKIKELYQSLNLYAKINNILLLQYP